MVGPGWDPYDDSTYASKRSSGAPLSLAGALAPVAPLATSLGLTSARHLPGGDVQYVLIDEGVR